MSEPTFHTVSWAPSAIKDAVEHATEAFKAADGAFARVSTFELSALIDATRALIEHNEQAGDEESELERLRNELATARGAAALADVVPLRERIAEAFVSLDVRDWGGDHGFTTYGNDDESDAFVDAAHDLVAGEIDRLIGVVVERGEVIRQLRWLHAEAMWHAEHHRAQAAADLQKIAVAMHLKPTAGVDSIVHWAQNHVDSIRDLALERDKVWEVLLPLLEQHPLSKDDVQDDELRERRRAGRLAELGADVLRWQIGEIERLKDVDAEAFAARFQVQSYDIELGRAGRTLARLLTEAGVSPLPDRLWYLAHRVKEEFEDVVRQRDDALAALEKQQALVAQAISGEQLARLHRYARDLQESVPDISGDDNLSTEDAYNRGYADADVATGKALEALLDVKFNALIDDPQFQAALTNESSISSRWSEGDIALDHTNFVHRRFEHGWRVVGRNCGVQYDDESMETALGPLLRLSSVPDEVDVVGAVPVEVAERLRAEASRG